MAVAKPHELNGLLSGRRELPACILIHGSDRGAVFDLCQSVIAKVTGGKSELDVVRLTEAQRDRLYTEFSSISMFGGKQVVWLAASGDNSAKTLEPILESETQGNLILIDSDSLTKASKLRKLCEASPRAVSIAIYEESVHELRRRLGQRIKEAGFAITEEAMELLMELVSHERSVGNSEVEKLTLYAHGKTSIDVDDVRAACGDSYDASTDDLLDSVFEGNMADADRFASILDMSGQGNILGSALGHVSRLQAMAGQMAKGQSPDQIVRLPANGIFFRRQTAVSHQLRLWSMELLLEAEDKIASGILQTRRQRELESAITSRTLLAVSWLARNQSV
jgi:DNA polymerase III subunit delta